MAIVLPRRLALTSAVLLAVVLLAGAYGVRQGIRLNAPLVPDGDVTSAVRASRHAVYLADQVQDSVNELFAVALDPPFATHKLSGPLVTSGDVTAFFVASPDATRVVYRADQDANEVFEIFSVPIAGDEASVQLNGPLALGGDVSTTFRVSPDSTRVVYLADQDADEVLELFSVPIQGGTPVQLNASLAAGGDVFAFQISLDSARVVYVADQDLNDRPELYSAPIDGSAGPTRLNAPLVPGGAVYGLAGSFAISSDSLRVVYRAEQDADELIELFSVPTDGGAAPLQLNGTLVALGDVASSWISPDSSRVVYVADQDADEVYELFSVPIDASLPAVRLNGPLAAGGDVTLSFPQISPDSSRVVYTADQDTNDVHELYSVPTDGSAAPVKLHPALPAGRAVNAAQVRVDSDSTRVVFLSNADSPLVHELFSAPIDASGPPVELNPPLVSGGNVADFVLDPRGRRVAYRADLIVDERFELFAVPIDGRTPSRRVNDDLAPGGQVGFYSFTGDGGRVLYMAGKDVATQIELFLSYLTPIYRRSR